MDSAELAVMEFGRQAVISKEAQGICTNIAACSDLPYLHHHLPSQGPEAAHVCSGQHGIGLGK